MKASEEIHLCDTCQHEFATCTGYRIVWSIVKYPEARGADADKVLACGAFTPRPEPSPLPPQAEREKNAE